MKGKCLLFFALLMTLGIASVTPASAFFTIGEQDGRWWFFDSDGQRFFSTGINAVTPFGHYCPDLGYSPYYVNIMNLYGSEEAWADVTLARMEEWNFNTLGGWCSTDLFNGEIPYTVILYMSGADWLTGYVPDYWGSDFYERVAQKAGECAALADDPLLLGYFIDNEMRWGPDWRRFADLFADYMLLPIDSPGKTVLIDWLRERYHDDLIAFNFAYGWNLRGWWELAKPWAASPLPKNATQKADREAWTAYVADHFFQVTTAAIRAADPNHLILGVRFVSWLTPTVALTAAAEYLDVVSVNHYLVWLPFAWTQEQLTASFGFVSTTEMLQEFHDLSGLPVLISEFSMRGLDAVPPSTWPPPFLFKTAQDQTQRAEWAMDYVHQCTHSDFIIGYHWFDYMDEPALGRFDGEDSNFGLVTENDDPYTLLIEAFAQANIEVYDWPFWPSFPAYF